MKTLYVIDGPIKGASFQLDDDITTVGRAPDNDICISDIGVSRHHARLLLRNNKIFIVDTKSLRGVFIDGMRIMPETEVEIKADSILIMGNTVLSLQKESLSKTMAQVSSGQEGVRPLAKPGSTDASRDYTPSLELLFTVSNMLAQSLDINEVLGDVIDHIFNLLKRIDRGAILLLDKATGNLREAVSKTRAEDTHGVFSTINYSRTIVNRTLKTGKPVMMSDTSRLSKVELSESIQQMNIRSIICVPLIYKGVVRGIIYVDSVGSPEGFRKDDLRVLTTLSNTAAIAIENAQLYDAMNQELAERRRAEQALEKARNELEKRVEQRTAELSKTIGRLKQEISDRKQAEEERKNLEIQLQHAQRMEALGTLAGGIAHNFNNILMGISGNASLILKETDPTHPNYQRINDIEKLIDSGSRLTKQLVSYAQGGKYQVRSINLNRVIADTAYTFGSTKRDIIIHQDLVPELEGVLADRGQIEQALLNLFINAADAMPRGGDLFIATRTVMDRDMTGKPYRVKPGAYCLLTVRDTGVGMDAKTTERIFDPFFTTKSMSHGTGLGLASTYGIIKAHGGYIDADSRKGQGTTFMIYLPVSQESPGEPKEDLGHSAKGTGSILLVDDESMLLEVGAALIRELGYTVLVAQGGKQAVELFRKHKDAINLVILDMIMPDMGGGETYDAIKELNPAVKVLLSSGYSIDGQAREIMDRGCNGFIQKPFTIHELSAKIKEILRKGTPGSSART